MLELFLWMTNEQSRNLEEGLVKRVEEEAADIMIFLIYLADSLGIDLLEAAGNKLEINRRKYPADLSRGSSLKRREEPGT